MDKKNKKRIILTGGHAGTTALAVIQELEKNKDKWEIYWIGASKAMESGNVQTLESKVFPDLNIHYCTIFTGRLQRKLSWQTIPSLIKIPIGFVHALFLLIKIRPNIILSFGGFAALPVVVMAWIMRIPIIIHEQTVAVGLANKLSARFANKIAIARYASAKYFPQNKIVLTGNPVMSQILKVKPKNKIGNPPTIYITGGSRGAQIINNAILKILPELLNKFVIYHHTGVLDLEKFNKFKNINYHPKALFDPLTINTIFEKADIIISRAGANTISEIIVTGRPAILIPIPWARFDEQNKNAKYAEDLGIAKIINQNELTSKKLLKTILHIKKNWYEMKINNTNAITLDKNASKNIVNLINSELV